MATLTDMGLTLVCALIAASAQQQEVDIAIFDSIQTKPVAQSSKYLIGSYYFGDGTGVNCHLTLKEDSTFTFKWTGCLGVYDENEGTWSLQNDVVVMDPQKPNDTMGFKGMNVRFVPVRLGEDVFLVDEMELGGFASSLTRIRDMTRPYTDYRKVINNYDWKKISADAQVDMPERYRHYVTEGEIHAKITKVTSDGFITMTSKDASRIAVGTVLTTVETSGKSAEVRIYQIKGNTLSAEFVYTTLKETHPPVGTVYTTGTCFNRPHGSGAQRYTIDHD